MSGGASNPEAFRPAPFPVYAPDHRPGLAALIRRGAALLGALLLLAPLSLYTGRADSGGTQVATIELGLREPVLLSCDFSLEGFTACPPELGAFTGERQFVCSGEAPRGMLYGTLDGSPRIVLVTYDENHLPGIDRLLAEIRQRVDLMNDRRNMLRQAKQRRGPPPVEQTGLPDWFWDPAPGTPAASSFVELAQGLGDAGLTDKQAAERLRSRAADTASLKRLYYSAQEARIDLLAAQFDLQLALAQSPEQDVPGMLVLGGSAAAREAMLTEVDRLAAAWRGRLDELETQASRDRTWLRTEQTPRPPSGWGVFSFLPGTRELETELSGGRALSPGTPASCLELGYRVARLAIAESEIEAIRSGLDRLESLDRRVESGLSAGMASRRVALGEAAFTSPALEELPGYPALTQIVREGKVELLWAQLAAEFAGLAEAPPQLAESGGVPEALYCLAAAELEAHLSPERAGPGSGGDAPEGEHSQARLSAYEGFIEFARWYTGLAGQLQ